MMKMKYYVCVMMTALIFTACQDDREVINSTEQERYEEEEQVALTVALSLNEYNSTYASTENKPDRETGAPIKEVDLYAFRENGSFYQHIPLTDLTRNGNVYISKKFEFPKGYWYFYVVVNKPDNFMQEPTSTTTITEFEKQRVVISTTGDWMTRDLLIMATPVREMIAVTGEGDPQIIRLKVGHLFSKVEVVDGHPATAGGLKGTFRSRTGTIRNTYSVGCEPNSLFLIGQWRGNFMGELSQVISPHYENYDTTLHFTSPLYHYPSLGTGSWYTIENTNFIPNVENTSCFILQYKYSPHASEIHTVEHKPEGVLPEEGTFYVAEFKDGSRVIYESDPSGEEHPTLGKVENVKYYQYGYCYYRVPIQDDSKPTHTLRYSTIRNHYYRLTVKSISGLGNNTEDDWSEWAPPWEEEAEIDANLLVQDWVPYEIPVDLE